MRGGKSAVSLVPRERGDCLNELSISVAEAEGGARRLFIVAPCAHAHLFMRRRRRLNFWRRQLNCFVPLATARAVGLPLLIDRFHLRAASVR